MRQRLLIAGLALVCVSPLAFAQNTAAEPAARMPLAGDRLTIELSWQAPVDLDLFLTGPDGETIYFGNRAARAGYEIDREATCATIAEADAPYRETAVIQSAAPGTYRVSVDYILDCGVGSETVDASVALFVAPDQTHLGGNQISVTQQRLKTVAWTFEVKGK